MLPFAAMFFDYGVVVRLFQPVLVSNLWNGWAMAIVHCSSPKAPNWFWFRAVMTLSLSYLINHFFFASPFFRSHGFCSVSFRRIMSGNQDMYRRIIVVHQMFHSFIFPVFCRLIFCSINNKKICMCPRQPKRNHRKKELWRDSHRCVCASPINEWQWLNGTWNWALISTSHYPTPPPPHATI